MFRGLFLSMQFHIEYIMCELDYVEPVPGLPAVDVDEHDDLAQDHAQEGHTQHHLLTQPENRVGYFVHLYKSWDCYRPFFVFWIEKKLHLQPCSNSSDIIPVLDNRVIIRINASLRRQDKQMACDAVSQMFNIWLGVGWRGKNISNSRHLIVAPPTRNHTVNIRKSVRCTFPELAWWLFDRRWKWWRWLVCWPEM